MTEIGIRELKADASNIMRNVSRRKKRYLVTCRGRLLGVIAPVQPGEIQEEPGKDPWLEMETVAKKLAAEWKSGTDPLQTLDGMRR